MLEARGVCAGYRQRSVLDNVDLAVARGELVALLGPNGCGKTTLLRVVSGVLPYGAGSVQLDGTEIHDERPEALARRIAVVAQDAALPARFTAFDLVMMGRTPHLRLLQWEGRRDVQIVRGAMERTGCWDLRARMVDELSGGERQRVILARALAQEPDLLLLDEPTSHLDLRHQVDAFTLVRELCRETNIAVIAVVHDLTLAAMFAGRAVLLSAGRNIASGSPADVITADRIAAVYGVPVRILADPLTGRPIVMPDIPQQSLQQEVS